jgi:hypothetical protein
MALNQVQLDGEKARETVKQLWPNATSSYTGAFTAEVYDPTSGKVLGQAEATEFAVEHAWIDAANSRK